MKRFSFLTICLLAISMANAQQTFSIPEVSANQEKEILYNHVMAYFGVGITFAKTQGVSAKEYGQYIGEQFKPYWNPEAGFPFFVNQMMFMLKGVNSFSEMQITEQSETMIRFKMSNLDMMFQHGPMYGITYKEFLEASDGLISTLAKHMNVAFEQKLSDDGWYVVTMKSN